MAASYKGPEPIALIDGTFQCGQEGCTRSFPTEQGTKAHWSREHNGGGKRATNGHTDEMFATVAAVTRALVADRPEELYERMEEIVVVRKVVLQYLDRRP